MLGNDRKLAFRRFGKSGKTGTVSTVLSHAITYCLCPSGDKLHPRSGGTQGTSCGVALYLLLLGLDEFKRSLVGAVYHLPPLLVHLLERGARVRPANVV